jgi:hypothetical protein
MNKEMATKAATNEQVFTSCSFLAKFCISIQKRRSSINQMSDAREELQRLNAQKTASQKKNQHEP